MLRIKPSPLGKGDRLRWMRAIRIHRAAIHHLFQHPGGGHCQWITTPIGSAAFQPWQLILTGGNCGERSNTAGGPGRNRTGALRRAFVAHLSCSEATPAGPYQIFPISGHEPGGASTPTRATVAASQLRRPNWESRIELPFSGRKGRKSHAPAKRRTKPASRAQCRSDPLLHLPDYIFRNPPTADT